MLGAADFSEKSCFNQDLQTLFAHISKIKLIKEWILKARIILLLFISILALLASQTINCSLCKFVRFPKGQLYSQIHFSQHGRSLQNNFSVMRKAFKSAPDQFSSLFL